MAQSGKYRIFHNYPARQLGMVCISGYNIGHALF